MSTRTRSLPLLPLFVAIVAAACGDAGGDTETSGSSGGTASTTDPTGGATRVDVALRFVGAVGTEAFSCAASYPGVGSSGSTVEVMDFRFYVHGVELLTKGGDAVPLELKQDGVWQHEDVALIDLEDGSGSCANGSSEVNDTIVGEAPEGEYEGVRFVLGVPFAQNHGDAAVAPSPLNLTPMFWSWQAGYKFARIDLKSAAQDLWAIHLGSTGCEMDGDNQVTGCAAENRASVELTGFDPTSRAITADILALVQTADLDANQMGTAPGCMSEPADTDCSPVFAGFGLPFDGVGAAAQTFFSVR